MITHVLCPVDFSDASRSSLLYAAALAGHFSARLTVLTVDDPLLAQVAANAGAPLVSETGHDLRRFCADIVSRTAPEPACMVATGKPASEILREAGAGTVDLIVMSSQGRSGGRKLFFGSMTERVLRDTTVPVLVIPAGRPGASPEDDVRRLKRSSCPSISPTRRPSRCESPHASPPRCPCRCCWCT